MLVLKRTYGEEVIIDFFDLIEVAVAAAGSNGKLVEQAMSDFLDRMSTIRVKVNQVRGDDVRLGFVGPRNLPIHRREVYERDPNQLLGNPLFNQPGN